MDRTERSRLARVITWLIVGLIVVLLIRLVFALLRVSIGIVGWLLFTVVPLILIGWLVMKLWERYQRGRTYGP